MWLGVVIYFSFDKRTVGRLESYLVGCSVLLRLIIGLWRGLVMLLSVVSFFWWEGLCLLFWVLVCWSLRGGK